MSDEMPDRIVEPLSVTMRRFCVVVVLGIAFAYIEAAVVVYLRQIFYDGGFSFPLAQFGLDVSGLWRRLLLTEVGREAATIVLVLSGAWLAGRNRQERVACFMAIFGVWDIFFYVWLKALINWPGSVMDWDILFLIPVVWAGPVLAPVLVSAALVLFALIILYCSSLGRRLKVTVVDWLGFFVAADIVVVSFCLAGVNVTRVDYRSHFYPLLFGAGYMIGLAQFARCLVRSKGAS
ncbi:MAG: hypothetical protein ACYTBJ_05475 [Planctomycetota bacterium]|jgi:hypothetical protein